MLQLNRSPLMGQPESYTREPGHHLDARFPVSGPATGGPGGGPFPGAGAGHPMAAGAAHLMSLNNPAALLSRTGKNIKS